MRKGPLRRSGPALQIHHLAHEDVRDHLYKGRELPVLLVDDAVVLEGGWTDAELRRALTGALARGAPA